MSIIGTVESVWRYPVKSMRGEELDEIFVGFNGVKGDRLFAFHSSAARPDFPYFTARQQNKMLLYRPRLNSPDQQSIEVIAPSGETVAIDDPALIDLLKDGAEEKHQLTLKRSERAFTDAYPVSLISLQTVHRLAEESGTAPEKRRFRANIFLQLNSGEPFAEDKFVGCSLRIGPEVVVSVAERDDRCVMINLHPDTAEASPSVLKQVAHSHQGSAGVYGGVVVEGKVRKGDQVELVD